MRIMCFTGIKVTIRFGVIQSKGLKKPGKDKTIELKIFYTHSNLVTFCAVL